MSDANPQGVPSDFAETLFWYPLLRMDPRGNLTDAQGRPALFQFDLSDSVAAFDVLVDAHTDRGRIGSGRAEIVSRVPFSLQPELPPRVTSGDRIDLPLTVVNNTQAPQSVLVAFRLGAGVAELGAGPPPLPGRHGLRRLPAQPSQGRSRVGYPQELPDAVLEHALHQACLGLHRAPGFTCLLEFHLPYYPRSAWSIPLFGLLFVRMNAAAGPWRRPSARSPWHTTY